MRIILFISLIFTSYSFSNNAIPIKSWDLDTYGENTPIKLMGKLFFIHQYYLDIAFGRVNDYLCLFRNTEYQNFSNLQDGVGYEAILDNNACENGEVNLPWLVVSKQETTSDNLVMELSMPNNVADARIKLTLEEETTSANPYGVLTLDYKYVSAGNVPRFGPVNTPLYNTTYRSSVLENNQVKYEAAVLIDKAILSPMNAEQESYFFGTKILHTKNSGGHGTVTEFDYRQIDSPFLTFFPDYFPNGYTKLYPDGNPYNISVTNFAYNDNVVKYQTHYGYSGTKVQIYNDDTDSLETPLANEELCVSRTGSWEYVPPIRYGVFDSNGNRISFNALIDPNDANQVVQATLQQAPLIAQYNFDTTNTLWLNDPTIKIFNAGWLGNALQCKKIEDGTLYGNGLCPGTSLQDNPPTFRIVRINGEDYQNFPLFDIPEGTVLTVDGGDQDGEEYYVRHLGVAKVYPAKPQGDADCDSLTIQPSEDTPDHTFFNYPEVVSPRTGAVLVNKLNATTDLFSFSQGLEYPKNGDADNDGILNYLDAFPEDATKSLDADHDLVADSEDTTANGTTPFLQDWTNHKHLDKAIYSNYQKQPQN